MTDGCILQITKSLTGSKVGLTQHDMILCSVHGCYDMLVHVAETYKIWLPEGKGMKIVFMTEK